MIHTDLPRGEARVCVNSKFRNLAFSLLRDLYRSVDLYASPPLDQGMAKVRATQHQDCRALLRSGQNPDRLFWVSPDDAVDLLMTDLREPRFRGIPMSALKITGVILDRTLLDEMSGPITRYPEFQQLHAELLAELKQR